MTALDLEPAPMDATTTLLRQGADRGQERSTPLDGLRPRWTQGALDQLNRWRGLLLVVVLPTLLAAIYLFGIATRQYESEAHFVVKSASQSNNGPSSSLAQMFGLSSGLGGSQSESYIVSDYLSSNDAVAALRKRFDLVRMFRRPEADPMTRLWNGHPTAEQLLKYYRRQVKVIFSSDTGITTLRIHAFRAADAHTIAEALLELSEQRVNLLNERGLANAEAVAERRLHEAETAVAASQGGVTRLRQDAQDVDPDRSGLATISMLAELRGELTLARAQLAAMNDAIRPDSPQYVALAKRVRSLEAQVNAASGKLAGPQNTRNLGAFENLKLRQDFAAKRYEAAAAALETARAEALKQQYYVLRIVEPNLPEKALFPQRWLILASVFFAALLTYGIGSLILAGVREHAA